MSGYLGWTFIQSLNYRKYGNVMEASGLQPFCYSYFVPGRKYDRRMHGDKYTELSIVPVTYFSVPDKYMKE